MQGKSKLGQCFFNKCLLATTKTYPQLKGLGETKPYRIINAKALASLILTIQGGLLSEKKQGTDLLNLEKNPLIENQT
ncbi:MAG: hypothetical protein CL674_14615 [Bdellovibrionaceae bacterium]|nr:hypothetical protein [Pseudobdellovibrionaceae bacterium]